MANLTYIPVRPVTSWYGSRISKPGWFPDPSTYLDFILAQCSVCSFPVHVQQHLLTCLPQQIYFVGLGLHIRLMAFAYKRPACTKFVCSREDTSLLACLGEYLPNLALLWPPHPPTRDHPRAWYYNSQAHKTERKCRYSVSSTQKR